MSMKKQIWKFEIKDLSCAIFEMPKGSKILSIQTQKETPCIWVLVNPLNEKELRHFEVYGTGHDISFNKETELKFINTFQLHGGNLVFHLFERISLDIKL